MEDYGVRRVVTKGKPVTKVNIKVMTRPHGVIRGLTQEVKKND